MKKIFLGLVTVFVFFPAVYATCNTALFCSTNDSHCCASQVYNGETAALQACNQSMIEKIPCCTADSRIDVCCQVDGSNEGSDNYIGLHHQAQIDKSNETNCGTQTLTAPDTSTDTSPQSNGQKTTVTNSIPQ